MNIWVIIVGAIMQIDVQGVQGVQGGLCRVKTMSGMACAGCAGSNPLARVRVCVRRVFLIFILKFIPCTPCTPCTDRVISMYLCFFVLHMSLHTLHNLSIDDVMDKKRRQWELIREQDPKLADWLVAMNQAFGKPAALSVELANGVKIVSGVFNQGLGFDDKETL